MKKLEEELYVTKPESLVIISPHGQSLEDAFNINLNSDYIDNSKEFRDFYLELFLHSLANNKFFKIYSISFFYCYKSLFFIVNILIICAFNLYKLKPLYKLNYLD